MNEVSGMARKKQFAISFHHRSTMTLILISVVMLLPFYYTPQLAWSQSLETAQDNAYTRAQT
ncbi:MAG TPA: hypothetical protein VFZ67_05835, partial [Nitrososphaera sp.]